MYDVIHNGTVCGLVVTQRSLNPAGTQTFSKHLYNVYGCI